MDTDSDRYASVCLLFVSHLAKQFCAVSKQPNEKEGSNLEIQPVFAPLHPTRIPFLASQCTVHILN